MGMHMHWGQSHSALITRPTLQYAADGKVFRANNCRVLHRGGHQLAALWSQVPVQHRWGSVSGQSHAICSSTCIQSQMQIIVIAFWAGTTASHKWMYASCTMQVQAYIAALLGLIPDSSIQWLKFSH